MLLWFVGISVYDGANTNTYYVCGGDARAAEALADAERARWPNPPYTVTLSSAAPTYFLMSKGLMLGFLENFTMLSQGQPDATAFKALIERNAVSLGVDPHVSPKSQKIRPWNGKKR